LTDGARKALSAITDRRIREKLEQRIEGLSEEPEMQGKPLGEELAGYRSVRAVGQRYRIIYKVERQKVVVIVIAVGLRRERDKADIYQLAKRLIRLGLVE
jgi:mRNA interferase RelE/StbE